MSFYPSTRATLLFVAIPVLLGCSQDRELRRRRELHEIAAHHQSQLAEFEQARAELSGRSQVPQELSFQQSGTIFVEECELRGYPQHEEFWLKYTWVNNTDQPIDRALVTITLRDRDRDAEHVEEMELRLPFSASFGRDSSYTTYLALPIREVELGPNLDWKIQVQALIRADH